MNNSKKKAAQKKAAPKTLHFIAGLPRAGSTMLSAILKQNPNFHASMTSPVSAIFKAMEDVTSQRVEGAAFISDKQRDDLLKGVFENYYKDNSAGVIFDTSRMWCARMTALSRLFPDAKVIVMVREMQWIADSFERLYRKNGQRPSGIYDWDTSGTVWTRIPALMNSAGVIGYSYDAIREALASDEKDNVLLVDYEAFCRSPETEIKKIYKFIGQPLFTHDFSNVEYQADEYDNRLGAKTLHTVKGAVEWKPRKTILPPALFARYINDNFWRQKTIGDTLPTGIASISPKPKTLVKAPNG